MNPDGSQQTRLTWTGWVTEFDWSPSGKQIVFSGGGDEPLSDIYLVDVETSTVRALTDNQARSFGPVWSPDGHRIAFKSERENDIQIYVLDIDSLEETRVTDSADPKGDVSWSPNGQFLAYKGGEEVGPPALKILDLETGITATFSDFWALDKPVWSPDSQYLSYAYPED